MYLMIFSNHGSYFLIRDGDRAVVLAHVKGHYRQQQEAAMVRTFFPINGEYFI